MGDAVEPRSKGSTCSREGRRDACEWVVAAGADPDAAPLFARRWVCFGFRRSSSRSAVHMSNAAKCAVLLPIIGSRREHRFAGLDDCVAVHEWMTANGPSGPKAASVTFIAGDRQAITRRWATPLSAAGSQAATTGWRYPSVADDRPDVGEPVAEDRVRSDHQRADDAHLSRLRSGEDRPRPVRIAKRRRI